MCQQITNSFSSGRIWQLRRRYIFVERPAGNGNILPTQPRCPDRGWPANPSTDEPSKLHPIFQRPFTAWKQSQFRQFSRLHVLPAPSNQPTACCHAVASRDSSQRIKFTVRAPWPHASISWICFTLPWKSLEHH